MIAREVVLLLVHSTGGNLRAWDQVERHAYAGWFAVRSARNRKHPAKPSS